jgi:Ca2+-dependent lipid-binding protein
VSAALPAEEKGNTSLNASIRVATSPTSPTVPAITETPQGLVAPPPLKEGETFERAIGWVASSERRQASAPSFLKDKFYGHSLNNSIAVFVVCFFTYVLAWLGFGLAWCFPLWAVFGNLYSVWVTVDSDVLRHFHHAFQEKRTR